MVDAMLQLQTNWMADYRNSSGIVVADGEYGADVESRTRRGSIHGSSGRSSAICAGVQERLDAFSRLDRAAGEG